MEKLNIQQLRQNIDQIDSELLGLIEKRMEIAKSVGLYKKENALPVRDRERERQILERLCEKSKPELKDCIESIYSVLFEASSNLQSGVLHSDSP